jgi:hypothetical protein
MIGSAPEGSLVANERAPVSETGGLEDDVARSRETSARLMDNLAHRMGASRSPAFAPDTAGRGMAAVGRAARAHPVAAVLMVVAAGFLFGRVLRSR